MGIKVYRVRLIHIYVYDSPGKTREKLCEKLGNLRTDDGDATDDANQKVDINFTLECRR